MAKPLRTTQILASVELGNPAANCANFGICSVTVLSPRQWAIFKPLHIRHTKARLSVTANGCLRFDFPLASMRADTRAQFFPTEGFRVDAATVLPKSITRLLQLPLGSRMMPGVYEWSLRDGTAVVELSVCVSI